MTQVISSRLPHSVDIVPVVENRPHVSIPTLITEITDDHQTPPTRRKGSETESTLNILQSRETLLDSSIDSPLHSRRGIGSNTESQEDLLEDTRIQRSLKERLKYHELSNESEITILNSYELKDDAEERTILESLGSQTNGFSVNERVERVQSMVAPRSYATPEKIILHDIEEPDADSNNEWMEANFPAGSRSVTIPRGDKGFGIILVEEKVGVSCVWWFCRYIVRLHCQCVQCTSIIPLFFPRIQGQKTVQSSSRELYLEVRQKR